MIALSTMDYIQLNTFEERKDKYELNLQKEVDITITNLLNVIKQFIDTIQKNINIKEINNEISEAIQYNRTTYEHRIVKTHDKVYFKENTFSTISNSLYDYIDFNNYPFNKVSREAIRKAIQSLFFDNKEDIRLIGYEYVLVGHNNILNESKKYRSESGKVYDISLASLLVLYLSKNILINKKLDAIENQYKYKIYYEFYEINVMFYL